jgi:predicted secreted protein
VWRNLVARRLWVAEVPGSNPGTPIVMTETHAGERPGGRAKPILLAALMAFLALNVWTGSPLLALWIGSRIQGEESQPSMGAYAAVIVCLVAFSWGLYQLLKLTMAAYQEATGTQPTVRTHAPWLRSMRGERPEQSRSAARISAAEKIVVVSVIIAAIVFEIWFFFFSGSSIGGG